MAVQMTRAEYEAKYGAPPAPKPAPVQMTRAQYEAKYNPKPPAPSIGDRIMGAAKAVTNFVGGNALADQLGTRMAQVVAPNKEQRDLIGQTAPSARATIGSALQVGSALLPVGRIASGLTKGATALGLGAKAARPIGAIGSGLGAGYSFDVGANLQAEKSGAEAFRPGFGTALGGALPAGGMLIGGGLNKLAARTPDKQLGAHVNRLKTLQNVIKDNTVKQTVNGQQVVVSSPLKTFSEMKLIPKVVEGKVDATDIVETLTRKISGTENEANKIIAAKGGSVPAQKLEEMVLKTVNASDDIKASLKLPQALTEVEARMKALRQTYGNDVPYEAIDSIRTAMNKVYDPETRDVARAIGDAMRKVLYKTHPTVQGLMREEGKYIGALRLAEKMHGTAIKGGRMGQHFAQLGGTVVGTAVGSVFGGGPVGGIAGAIVGGSAGRALHSAAQKMHFNTPLAKTAAKLVDNMPSVRAPGDMMLGRQSKTVSTTQYPTTQQNINSSIKQTLPQNPLGAPKDVSPSKPNTLMDKAKGLINTIKIEGRKGHADFFAPLGGKGKRLGTEDLTELSDFTDMVSGRYKPRATDAHNLEVAARRLVETYTGRKVPKTVPALRDAVSRVLDEHKFRRDVSATTKPNNGGVQEYDPKTGKFGKKKVVSEPLGATKQNKANGDKKNALGDKSAWLTTASKPSKAGGTSTGSVPTGKGGVSAQQAGTSGPFDGRAPSWKDFRESNPQLFEHKAPLTRIVNDSEVSRAQVEWNNYGQYEDRTVELRNNLLEAFSTDQGQQTLKKIVDALPKNSDGTITAYRTGEIVEGVPQSYTLSDGMAQTFSHQGTDIPAPFGTKTYDSFGSLGANAVRIDPKGIRAWSPWDVEVLADAKYVKPAASSPSIPKELEPLAAEARKAKTVEDFAYNLSARDYIELRTGGKFSADGFISKSGVKITTDLRDTRLSEIQATTKGTGAGSELINAWKEWSGLTRKSLEVPKAYNAEFWKKMGFTRSINDRGMFTGKTPSKDVVDLLTDFYNKVKGSK